jgi:hypothetical protein
MTKRFLKQLMGKLIYAAAKLKWGWLDYYATHEKPFNNTPLSAVNPAGDVKNQSIASGE